MNGIGLDFEKPIIELERKIVELQSFTSDEKMDLNNEIQSLQKKLEQLKKEIYKNLTPWQRVRIARHLQRPYMMDYVKAITQGFIELHGDRRFGDDKAMVGGFATIDGGKVLVIGHQKGRGIKQQVERNFGCAHPEGYRKALRLMKLAEKFDLPIISFIDTPGAYPGIGGEERGQAEAIAVNLREMVSLKTPIVVVVIGEGGSGGALGIGVGDRICVLENAYYSVISPEGCSAILWKKKELAEEAARVLKLTAKDLLELKIIDEIIP
ncbi:MAG: acetyl-CoA carboxylase carboxyltransferase subunit alpha, partial [Candidatus Omnitrophica bacterium]|nr:acetyl-CoA carboxylase carboxyltransferase subunit alpha [Candidatus Omnitrophota bacterium]